MAFLPISCFNELNFEMMPLPSLIFSSPSVDPGCIDSLWSSFESVETMLVMMTGHLKRQYNIIRSEGMGQLAVLRRSYSCVISFTPCPISNSRSGCFQNSREAIKSA